MLSNHTNMLFNMPSNREYCSVIKKYDNKLSNLEPNNTHMRLRAALMVNYDEHECTIQIINSQSFFDQVIEYSEIETVPTCDIGPSFSREQFDPIKDIPILSDELIPSDDMLIPSDELIPVKDMPISDTPCLEFSDFHNLGPIIPPNIDKVTYFPINYLVSLFESLIDTTCSTLTCGKLCLSQELRDRVNPGSFEIFFPMSRGGSTWYYFRTSKNIEMIIGVKVFNCTIPGIIISGSKLTNKEWFL